MPQNCCLWFLRVTHIFQLLHCEKALWTSFIVLFFVAFALFLLNLYPCKQNMCGIFGEWHSFLSLVEKLKDSERWFRWKEVRWSWRYKIYCLIPKPFFAFIILNLFNEIQGLAELGKQCTLLLSSFEFEIERCLKTLSKFQKRKFEKLTQISPIQKYQKHNLTKANIIDSIFLSF